MNFTESEKQEIAGRLVAAEVLCNVGGLVERLREVDSEDECLLEIYEPTGADYRDAVENAGARIEEAEDCYVLIDEHGESYNLDGSDLDEAAQDAVRSYLRDVEPEVDIYEFYAVTDWLAGKLRAKGEHVADFYGLDVWGRGCTGQAIKLDNSIQEIALEHERFRSAA